MKLTYKNRKNASSQYHYCTNQLTGKYSLLETDFPTIWDLLVKCEYKSIKLVGERTITAWKNKYNNIIIRIL